jgi:hypothetical protein
MNFTEIDFLIITIGLFGMIMINYRVQFKNERNRRIKEINHLKKVIQKILSDDDGRVDLSKLDDRFDYMKISKSFTESKLKEIHGLYWFLFCFVVVFILHIFKIL